MGDMHPVVVWLVVVVLGLQLAEFVLRAGRAAATRLRPARRSSGRSRFAAMTPLEKIETFQLGELDDTALQLFLDAAAVPSAERQRIEALRSIGRRAVAGPRAVPQLPTPPAGLASVERLPTPGRSAPPQAPPSARGRSTGP